ncbi:C13 family peptidase [uncultured Sphingomonas sp.]|uniref:C13 family peptidase n=1 Tax=uncultured Sphingomonas sp. TaxID=158754 RepID=UPI0025D2B7C5|nr:C13 family peptidase [uncultured Sphingomonas sp.]
MRMLLPLVIASIASVATAQTYQPVRHTLPAPVFTGGDNETQVQADMGINVERDRPARWRLDEHRRLDRTLAAVRPQRPGVVDAFVIVAALDSDPVFGREAREAARVLAHRYHADGHVILLAGSDGTRDSDQAMGSPGNLDLALARVAEVMDTAEDVLILYTTSHGAPFGLYYNDGDQGYGAVSPARLWNQLSTLGIRNRLLLLSACYSGVFVPMLSSDTTAIVTAAAADRPSFGCQADNDWTFFGDALVNTALRKPQPLASAATEAQTLIAGWERASSLDPSRPQVSIGAGARTWLAALERDLPPATPRAGRPAIALLQVK